jgi:hypothetical protein
MPTKEYYEKNKDKIKQQSREYYKNNKDVILERTRKGALQYYNDHKQEILDKWKKQRKGKDDKSISKLRRERDRHLQRRYGVSLQWYEDTLKIQGGGCFICGRMPGKNRNLHVDHCHKTNRVRGILCATCNGVLGRFYEDVSRFEKAIEYLRR